MLMQACKEWPETHMLGIWMSLICADTPNRAWSHVKYSERERTNRIWIGDWTDAQIDHVPYWNYARPTKMKREVSNGTLRNWIKCNEKCSGMKKSHHEKRPTACTDIWLTWSWCQWDVDIHLQVRLNHTMMHGKAEKGHTKWSWEEVHVNSVPHCLIRSYAVKRINYAERRTDKTWVHTIDRDDIAYLVHGRLIDLHNEPWMKSEWNRLSSYITWEGGERHNRQNSTTRAITGSTIQ